VSFRIPNFLGLTKVAADPPSPAEADLWWNTADQRVRVNGTAGIRGQVTDEDISAGAIRHRRAAGASAPWIIAPTAPSGVNTIAMSALGMVYFCPVVVTRPGGLTLQAWGLSVTTGVAAAVLRIASYTANLDTGLPTTLRVEGSATIDASTAGVKTLTQTLTLPVGLSWLAVVAQGALPTVQGVTGRSANVQGFTASIISSVTAMAYTTASAAVTAAYPSAAPAVTGTAAGPAFALQPA